MGRKCPECNKKFDYSYMWCHYPIIGNKRYRNGSFVGIPWKTIKNIEEECIPNTNKKPCSEDHMIE